MTQVVSSQVNRVFAEGTGGRFALFRMTGISSASSWDTTTEFTAMGQGAGLAAGFTTLNSTFGASSTITFAGNAAWTGLTAGVVWVGLVGTGK